MIKVEDMMTRSPHTLLRSDSLFDAKQAMKKYDIRHIPVVDDNNKLYGIVTQRDVLSAQESSLHKIPTNNAYTLNTPLNDIMHANVLSVEPRAGLKESAKYMQKHKIGCLPVIDKGQLVGIITDSDFVSIAINLLELQEDVEPEEIDPSLAFD
ncbi:CBS domain-containing protein [Vibrio sp. S4M6]|uniref:CBS domain-containing protein n=1 Tax=Vibrio sinus TaxID=2946865 RepID=UPI00202AB2F7|nr:CBS domain-containing protein [Vibrio sinus]MCL9781404.1 CBS domain-containing protein [Vibrio sinus]